MIYYILYILLLYLEVKYKYCVIQQILIKKLPKSSI